MHLRKVPHSELRLGEELPQGNNIKSSKFYFDEHYICDGNAKICRTKESGNYYQFIMWVRGENKHFRKSLREKDLQTSIKKGQEMYIKLMGNLYRGEKVFSINMETFIEIYLEYQGKRVKDELITSGRFTTIKSVMKHLLHFVGRKTRVDDIENKKYQDYFDFRRKHHPNVQNITLKNERSQISHLYKFGFDEGYINMNKVPRWSELKFSKPKSRYYLDRDNYRILYTYLKNWTKGITDEEDVYYRSLVRDFILVLSNTGLRFGECIQLRYSYLKLKKSQHQSPNIEILVPEHITKTRTERTCIGMRGDLFKRIKSYSQYTNPDDFVFTKFNSPEMVSKKVLYKYWKMIMVGSGLDKQPFDLSYYSLRHTFISYRLMYGRVDVFTLSKMVGTGIQYIQDHYGHLNIDDVSDDYTKNNKKHKEIDDMFGEYGDNLIL